MPKHTFVARHMVSLSQGGGEIRLYKEFKSHYTVDDSELYNYMLHKELD